MSNSTFKLFADKMGGTPTSSYIGTEGELFYDPLTTTLRVSNGVIPGGVIVSNIGMTSISSSMIPSLDNTFDIGTSDLRWRSLHIGPGSLFLHDITSGLVAELTIEDGILKINGANQLQVGQLKFVNNTIESTTSSVDIQIGLISSTADLVLNRNTVVAAGKTLHIGTEEVPTKTEADFNPLFTDASGTLAGVVSTGHYVKINGMCHFRIYVDFTNTTNYGTGQYQFTLPFPSAQTTTHRNGTLHQTTGPGAPSIYHISGFLDHAESTTVMKLYYFVTTTDLAWKYNTPNSGAFTGGVSHFDISGWFEIAN